MNSSFGNMVVRVVDGELTSPIVCDILTALEGFSLSSSQMWGFVLESLCLGTHRSAVCAAFVVQWHVIVVELAN